MRQVYNIAPRVVVYPFGTAPPPAVEEGWIALAQLTAQMRPARVVFGDGSHPSTRLCAAAVDLLCRQRPGLAVLDVGTGTGVLARIARARGAGFVVGTDIDPVAVACASANALLDVPATGSTDAGRADIYFGGEPPDHWGARFDLVVANILESPLHHLAPALRGALAPGAILLISGFTRPQIPSLRVHYEQEGLTFLGNFKMEEWVLLKFMR